MSSYFQGSSVPWPSIGAFMSTSRTAREAGVSDKLESEEKGRRCLGHSNRRKTSLHPSVVSPGGTN